MDIRGAFFYLFSAILLVSAFRVITARNPVHAALFLVLAFFQAAGVWLLLKAEFLAISLVLVYVGAVMVLVYVGAVMVLFLFVVMMLDIDVSQLRAGFWRHFPAAAIVGVVIALEMAGVLMGGFRPEEPRAFPAVAQAAAAGVQYSNTKELGKLLYSGYLFPLEIAAVILLVAIVAAIALTLRQRKDTKHIDPALQVRVKARDRFEIVKMPPVTARPVAAPAPAAAETKA